MALECSKTNKVSEGQNGCHFLQRTHTHKSTHEGVPHRQSLEVKITVRHQVTSAGTAITVHQKARAGEHGGVTLLGGREMVQMLGPAVGQFLKR